MGNSSPNSRLQRNRQQRISHVPSREFIQNESTRTVTSVHIRNWRKFRISIPEINATTWLLKNVENLDEIIVHFVPVIYLIADTCYATN